MRLIDTIVRALASTYGSLPLRPGGRALHWLLRRYMQRNARREVFATRDGIRYRLDLSEIIDANIYYRGVHEPRSTATVKRMVRPTAIALDIGANCGYYTLMLAKLVGNDGIVVAFEPTQWALGRLHENINLNGFSNIVVEKIALSDTSENRLISSDEMAFRASWTLDRRSSHHGTERVTFERLDDYLKRSGLARVDFMKIDVDGYELRVIRGAKAVIEQFKPSLLIEIGKYTMRDIGDDPEHLTSLLWDLGYMFKSDDGRRVFRSPGALIDAIPYDEPTMVICTPRIGL